MKRLIQRVFQRTLGYERYLFIFSWFKIRTLKYDRKENDFFHFLSLLDSNDTVIDAGANIGIMSYFLSRKCKSVFAFEPVPENYRTLEKIRDVFRLNNLIIHPVALGSTSGTVRIHVPFERGVKMQGLAHVSEGGAGGVEVPLRTLDSFDFQERISALKIDVENYEYQVLKGAEQLILKNKPAIYCELWENENRSNCFEFITSLGYKIKVKQPKGLEDFNQEIHRTQNFFFLPS